MLIFDQLRKNDPYLRFLAVVVLFGLGVLGTGLWWVQIVSARDYQADLDTQSFRTIRTPAIRGRILDRNGATLADNKPTYNVSLYLEELKDQFRKEYSRIRPRKIVTNEPPFWKPWITGSQVRTQTVRISREEYDKLFWTSLSNVASNSIQKISRDLQKPLVFDFTDFKRHYLTRRALPYPVAQRLGPPEIAKFEEKTSGTRGMDLEVQPTRFYPNKTTAAHLLGHLLPSDKLDEGELSAFDYRLPDFRGVIGIEYKFDDVLHGRAGVKQVLVNNLGYRQAENIWSSTEPGDDVVLTIDLEIQKAAERALLSANAPEPKKGAAVVMDVRTGDILAMASIPMFDPNFFVDRKSYPPDYYRQIQTIQAERNRATQDNYRPGSIFKTVVALACLENGLDPNAEYQVQPNPQNPSRGIVYYGRNQSTKDTAAPGPYKFKRALIHSSNAYFIHHGIQPGNLERIIDIGARLHLGESYKLGTRQETSGFFPDQRRIRRGWTVGDTANLCIGQGFIDVTPLQMTVLAAALANGGKVLWPRLVERVVPSNPGGKTIEVPPPGQVRNTLGVSARTLQIVKDAMLADVEDPEGTGRHAFLEGFRICGKTGTAENERGGAIDRSYQTTWFLSFAPYENPRYAMVVMVERGSSGGGTCAPLAKQIYQALMEREQRLAQRGNLAKAN